MGQKAGKRDRRRGKKRRERGTAQAAVVAVAMPAIPPPASEESNAAGALSAVAPVAEPDIEIDLTAELMSIAPEPLPSEPPPRMRSGVVPRVPDAPRVDDETLADHLVSLRPFYRDADNNKGERASELKLEDLSLRFDNPYATSPLVPPPEPALPKRALGMRIVSIASIGLLAASSSYGLWRAAQSFSSNREPDVAQAKATEAPPALARVAPTVERAQAVSATETPTATTEGPPSASDNPSAAAEPTAPPEQATAPVEPNAAASAESAAANEAPVKPLRLRKPRAATSDNAESAAPTTTATAPAPMLSARAAAALAAVQLAAPAAAPAATDLPAAVAELPKLPTPKAVRATFDRTRSMLSACVNGRKGIVTLRATIENSGHVSSGSVEGLFQSAEERDCLTHTILQLQFPAFKQDLFKMTYPMAL